MEQFSISAHFGKKLSREHNVRNRKITNSEKHIDPNGYYKVLEDKSVRQAYNEIFTTYVAEYNALQKRQDRKILDYFSKIYEAYKRDPNRNPATCQEVIFTIGNVDNHPEISKTEAVLTAFLERFKQVNPNVIVFGAYFHADEPGSAPHLHVDYILVKRVNKRGLGLQVGQEGALREMGYFSTGSKKEGNLITAQIQWQTAQRELLRTVAREYDLNVQDKGEHLSDKKHLDTEIFKRTTKLKALDEEIKSKLDQVKDTQAEAFDLQNELASSIRKKEELELEIIEKSATINEIDSLRTENRKIKAENSMLNNMLNLFQNAWNVAEDFLKEVKVKKGNSIWKLLKERLYSKFGKSKYDEFNRYRHNSNQIKDDKPVDINSSFRTKIKSMNR